MTAEILELMKERRKVKGKAEEYEQLDNQIRNVCRETKDAFLNKKCAETLQRQFFGGVLNDIAKLSDIPVIDKFKKLHVCQ